MSLNIKSKLICSALLLVIFNAQAQSPVVQYKNQRGSVIAMTLQDEGNNAGTLKGTFTTAVGNCQAEVGKPMALSGFYSGNAVTISVNYPKCKKTVAMTGHFSEDRSQLHTLWLVAEESNDPRGKNWNSNIVGADHYQLQS